MTTVVQTPTPISPKPLPRLNAPTLFQTLARIFRPLNYAEAARKRYGDIFSTWFANSNYVVVSHPQAIQEILTASPDLFESGRSNQLFFQTLLGENSMLLLDGDRHQRQRQLLMPPFHGERMRSYGHLICNVTEGVMQHWQAGKPFTMRESMQEISLRVILRAVFGLDEGVRYDRLRRQLSTLLDTGKSPFGTAMLFIPILRQDWGAWSPWGHYLRLKEQIDELIYAEIAHRHTHFDPSREDILTLMMLARDEAGEPMSDVELRDELMTLLVAGHETTATALAWAFYWIHQLPEVRHKLLAELDDIDLDTNPFSITKLPYLNAVCCETLRIYPVVSSTFARVLKAPFEVMGYQLDAGTVLRPHIYLTHHREDLYPEPKQFKPERFLERKFSAYEYLPFGGGNRRCIGYAFAQLEMKLVLATVLSQVKLALAKQRPVRPVRRGGTMGPSGGVRMVMTVDRG